MFDATTKAESYSERAFYSDQILPVAIYSNNFGMGRLALSCALFGMGRGPRNPALNVELQTFRGGVVSYTGPELRQDDATVLMGLIHAVRKGLVSDCSQFKPREFCASIGWSGDCTKTVKHLRECIERMQQSLLRVESDNGRGGRFHLVGDLIWEGQERWAVKLSATIIKLFEGGTTFLPIAERALLTDGMQTWLAGFIRAQSDEFSFATADLLKFSGSKADLTQFGKQLRETMPALKAAGVVKGFSFGRGRLRVER